MASIPIGREGGIVTLPSSTPPMPAVARILSRYDRDKLSAFVAVAIDLLDVLDGDSDEEDGTDAEDDFGLSPEALANADHGPGCIISDNDSCPAGDDKIAGNWDGQPGDPDDREDDDPAGQYDEDTYSAMRPIHRGPGCPIADPGEPVDGVKV